MTWRQLDCGSVAGEDTQFWHWGCCFSIATLIALISFVPLSAGEQRTYGGLTISQCQELIKSEPLEQLGQPNRVSVLLELISDEQAEWTARRQAALTLGRVGAAAKSAVPVFTRLLNSNDPQAFHTRLWSLRALALLGKVAEEATPQVAVLAADSTLDFATRASAIEALANVGIERPETLPVLIDILSQPGANRDSSVEERLIAAEALGILGPTAAPAVPELIRSLESDWALIQRAAAQTLGKIGVSAAFAVPALVDLIYESEGAEAQEAAAEALSSLGPDGALALKRLIRDPDPKIRGLALRGLKSLPASESLRGILIPVLSDSEPTLQVVAAEILLKHQFSAEQSLSVLINNLTSTDRNARIASYRAFSRSPDSVKLVRDDLFRLSEDKFASHQGREAARKLLTLNQ